MARHQFGMPVIDDWDARYRINEAIDALVDEADMSAEVDHMVRGRFQGSHPRHSTGRLDIDAEREALADWFGIE